MMITQDHDYGRRWKKAPSFKDAAARQRVLDADACLLPFRFELVRRSVRQIHDGRNLPPGYTPMLHPRDMNGRLNYFKTVSGRSEKKQFILTYPANPAGGLRRPSLRGCPTTRAELLATFAKSFQKLPEDSKWKNSKNTLIRLSISKKSRA